MGSDVPLGTSGTLRECVALEPRAFFFFFFFPGRVIAMPSRQFGRLWREFPGNTSAWSSCSLERYPLERCLESMDTQHDDSVFCSVVTIFDVTSEGMRVLRS